MNKRLKVNDPEPLIEYHAKLKGLKQKDIVAALGCSQTAVSLAVKGSPHLKRIRKQVVDYINNYQPTK